MAILGIKEKNGPWYLIDYSLLGPNEGIESMGRCDWADWDLPGDLLFAQSGCIYRLSPEKRKFGPIESSRIIADFSGLKFENVEPSPEALEWPRRSKPRRK
jgi:hypothetical protein